MKYLIKMDIQQPNLQSPMPIPANPGKTNLTNWIIIFVVIIAILVTGVTYFVVAGNRASKPINQATYVTQVSPSPTIAEQNVQWKRFTDEKNKYYFYYPSTWALTVAPTDPSKFELNYKNQSSPGTIIGRFLTKEENSLQICTNTNQLKQVCKATPISATTKAYMELNIEDGYTDPRNVKVMFNRPNQRVLYMEITKPNVYSYEALTILIDTIKFQGEARANKIQICPDAYSPDNQTVTYLTATFAIGDVDQEFIKTDCKK